jgi:hypothetical protein
MEKKKNGTFIFEQITHLVSLEALKAAFVNFTVRFGGPHSTSTGAVIVAELERPHLKFGSEGCLLAKRRLVYSQMEELPQS